MQGEIMGLYMTGVCLAYGLWLGKQDGEIEIRQAISSLGSWITVGWIIGKQIKEMK
jgi:hypothetical protein